MRSALKSGLLLLGGLLWASALADTLELRDGRTIEGVLAGASTTTVYFRIDNTIHQFSVRDVARVAFEERPEAPAVISGAPKRAVIAGVGTPITVRLLEDVNSGKNAIDDEFRAQLAQNFEVGDIVIANAGAEVFGKVSWVVKGDGAGKKPVLVLELSRVKFGDQLRSLTTVARGLATDSDATVVVVDGVEQLGVASNTVLRFRLKQPLSVKEL